MKRSAPPARRTPLKRTPIKTTRRAKSVDRDEIRETVFRRDGYRCRLRGVPGAGRCFGPLTFHHRRKDGQGGGYSVDNGSSLCVGHNDGIEADADLALLARTMGLVLKRGDVWTEAHDRFWALVRREGPIPEHRPDLGPCWMWMGTTRDGGTDGGYGRWRPHVDEPSVYVHRFALGCIEALVPGLEVDHLCRVRLCCNPRHLEQVTPAVNRRRQAEARPRPTLCRKDLHDMTDENSIDYPGRYGIDCRACKRDRQARNYRKRKQIKENPDAGLRSDRSRSTREGTSKQARRAPTSTPRRTVDATPDPF